MEIKKLTLLCDEHNCPVLLLANPWAEGDLTRCRLFFTADSLPSQVKGE